MSSDNETPSFLSPEDKQKLTDGLYGWGSYEHFARYVFNKADKCGLESVK